MTVAAVVAAAGRGSRLGRFEAGKALVEIGGRTLLELALENLVAAGVDELVVVHPAGQRSRFAAATAPHRVGLVAGGATRSDSVRHGVGAIARDHRLVAIHDAARPLVPVVTIRATIAAVGGEVVAAAPGLAVPDTLKRVGDGGVVLGTVDRAGVWAVHTPQVVRADVLRATLAWSGARHASDDLGLVEQARAAGVVTGEIRMVPGDPRGLKVTYRGDVEVAAALLAAGRAGQQADGGQR